MADLDSEAWVVAGMIIQPALNKRDGRASRPVT